MTSTLISHENARALLAHPIANMLPRMSDDAFDALRASIASAGQQTPIVLLNGMVLDGRHRLDALIELGRPVQAETLAVGVDPVAYVFATNMTRRHLTESQRAIVAARMVTTQRGQRAGAGDITQADAATRVGVSESYIRMAQYVIANGTEDVIDAIFSGERSLNTVYRQMRQAAAPAREPREVLITPITEVVRDLPREQADAPATALVQRIVEQGLDPAAWVRSLPARDAAALVTALEQFAREAFNVLDEEQDIGLAPEADSEEAEAHADVRVNRGSSRTGGATVDPI